MQKKKKKKKKRRSVSQVDPIRSRLVSLISHDIIGGKKKKIMYAHFIAWRLAHLKSRMNAHWLKPRAVYYAFKKFCEKKEMSKNKGKITIGVLGCLFEEHESTKEEIRKSGSDCVKHKKNIRRVNK